MHHDEEKKLEHAVKGGGEIVHNHIVKWYEQWLQGAGSDAETERRLEIMLEEVAIGEVLCFGAGQEILGRCSTPILSVLILSPLLYSCHSTSPLESWPSSRRRCSSRVVSCFSGHTFL